MHILTVSQFLAYVNDTFNAIWDATEAALEGEVSEFRVSQGQWVNFNLKDEHGLVPVFMVLRNLPLPVQDGMRVRLFGCPRVYAKYGKFSFQAERLELVGSGALQKVLAVLRQKLEQEGLFDVARKRALPRFPSRIALVASVESAAYGDFIRIVNERWGGLRIDAYHVLVQGGQAPDSILRALARIHNSSTVYDALVMTRGGGSLEELMAFNDERVVRALYASKIPTLVGIGHERDVTLAEEAADVRGSTPTDCARRLVPDRRDVLYQIAQEQARTAQMLDGWLSDVRQGLEDAQQIMTRWFQSVGHRLDLAARSLEQQARQWFTRLAERTLGLERVLRSLDPEGVLRRGYAIVKDPSGRVRVSRQGLDKGAPLVIEWRDGQVGARVEFVAGTSARQPSLL